MAWEGSGYEARADEGGFLFLKSKGDKIWIRIASEPYRYVDKFQRKDGSPVQEKRVAWKVIHKELVDGRLRKTARVYRGTVMVYEQIQELIKNPQWGDPTGYDIVVTRAESKQHGFYIVTPIDKYKGPISDDDLEKIEEAEIDLESMCKPRKVLEEQLMPPEDDPFADEPEQPEPPLPFEMTE